MRAIRKSIGAGALAAAMLSCTGDSAAPAFAAGGAMCAIGNAIPTDGYRRLALVVGVGDYRDDAIADLNGSVADARKIYDVLTDERLYGFPEENVCVLLDAAATKENFTRAFDEALVARVEGMNDVAVVFFAGHGSQIGDVNEDEPDDWDETFAFHDSDGWGGGELLDDDFHEMLQRLHDKTSHVVAIIDSCNSGSATRGASDLRARFLPRGPGRRVGAGGHIPAGEPVAAGDGADRWAPDSLPGLVVLTAASDGTSALEVEGKGIFTDALVSVLTEGQDEPLTYAQLARRVPPIMAASSYQVPYFQGDMNRPVFGNMAGTRPRGWDVIRVDPPRLGGPPLVGVGVGAEFRIFSGSATAADVRDPAKAKATAFVTSTTGLNADARVMASPGAEPIERGDLAILVRGGDNTVRIKVAIREASRPGGVPAERAAALRALIATDIEAKNLVELTASDEEFELSVDERDDLVLRGPENRVRNAYDDDGVVPHSLWQHARQKGLLQLRGEGGSDFKDQESLRVQVVPAPTQPSCADGEWHQAEPFAEQYVPLCHEWRVKVELAATARQPVLVGGLILSSDGATLGLPADGRAIELAPGDNVTFDTVEETFMGAPPLDVVDHVIVFGTQKTNPVPWHLLTEDAVRRGAAPEASTSPLYRALNAYLAPGTRGVGRAGDLVENTTWTMSAMTLRVLANDPFAKSSSRESRPTSREYTIANFDVRPYLPDDPEAAMYRVLQEAEWLAGASRREGFSYEQHLWALTTDAENLAVGIDCSRAIWFAFTRAGLAYNRSNQYLTTAEMVAADTLMNDEFAQCPLDQEPQIGDLLVYRSQTKGDGHVVMVIDPAKRIAWGSHGWDGNAQESDYVIKPETGVQYQLIKHKHDWARWDRRDMKLERCWQYRRFAIEAADGTGMPGQRALERTCSVAECAL
jgi:hypothetical protein